jgi:hypothetical protein
MMSDVRYEIKTPLPVIWLENIDTKKSGLVRTQRTNDDQLILVDPVEDEDVEDSSTDWSSKLLTMRSKEKKECYSHCYSLILIESIITLLFGYGNRIYSNIFIVITDYLPFVN